MAIVIVTIRPIIQRILLSIFCPRYCVCSWNALYFIVVFLLSTFLDGTSYTFLVAAFLCLLIPRYVLKHGKEINDRIISKMKDLASEIED